MSSDLLGKSTSREEGADWRYSAVNSIVLTAVGWDWRRLDHFVLRRDEGGILDFVDFVPSGHDFSEVPLWEGLELIWTARGGIDLAVVQWK